MILVDTDVLIWHLRGYAQAKQRLDQLAAPAISAMSYFELLQGMRNKAEISALKDMLLLRNAAILQISEAISRRAGDLMESLTLSHGLQAGDALIAATALEHQLPLLTGNLKHFTAVAQLRIEPFAV